MLRSEFTSAEIPEKLAAVIQSVILPIGVPDKHADVSKLIVGGIVVTLPLSKSYFDNTC